MAQDLRIGSGWRFQRLAIALLCVLPVSYLAAVTPASAQSAANPAGRDCQTVRTCQFARGGSFRGCISTYTCRTCRFVNSRCSIGTARGTCRELRCSWGA